MENKNNINTAYILPAFVLAGLLGAWLMYLLGRPGLTNDVLMATLALGSLPLVWRIVKNILNAKFGIDIIAITAIAAAMLMGQFLAGTVILLMLSGGEALEDYALRRARRELKALLSRAPSVAHIKLKNGISDVKAEDVKVGDVVVIKPGEVAPIDGLVMAGKSMVDESALTGESLPVQKTVSSRLLSGSVNLENVLEVRTFRQSKDSKYEQIIKLVQAAEQNRAPVVRLADRYSVWFTAITFIMGGLAWYLGHEPIRLLAVLVVATPCPLILATPIAIISGISRAASRGIIVKSGGALERLADIRAFIFDKTGTLTLGVPEVTGTKTFGISETNLYQAAASLDQLSAHILARSLLTFTQKQSAMVLDYPEDFQEFFGDGVKGRLPGGEFLFGKLNFLKSRGVEVSAQIQDEHEKLQDQGRIAVYLARGQNLVGAIYFADEVRPEIKQLFADVKKSGVDKIIMLTGDRKAVAETIAKKLGLTDIHAECLPEQKVEEVLDHKKQFGSVAMVGDGINDAPALATADVGLAVGGHGNTASSDTGDIVITVDNLERVGEALKIAKRVILIAKQGIFIGMGMSVLLMVFAAFGYIQPVYGAILQEILDVAVIINALRVNFEPIK